MKRLLTAMLACAPVLAGASDAPPWEGYWALDARWCAQAGEVGDGTPDWFGRDGLFGVEWSCEVRDVRETGVGQSWILDIDCLDAGFAYSESQIFMLTPHDRLMILTKDGLVHDLVRCEASR
ncbi:MAG: hypothetical protein AB3N23_22400 [Paracoccaceae bacterium]